MSAEHTEAAGWLAVPSCPARNRTSAPSPWISTTTGRHRAMTGCESSRVDKTQWPASGPMDGVSAEGRRAWPDLLEAVTQRTTLFGVSDYLRILASRILLSVTTPPSLRD